MPLPRRGWHETFRRGCDVCNSLAARVDGDRRRDATVYMIGTAIAPATTITAILYWLRVPTLDFAVSFATLWLVSGIVIELITPKPLSPFVALVTVAPMVIVGTVINFQCWRRSRRKPISISRGLTSSD